MGYGLFLASVAAVCWGFSPILQKRALAEMGLPELNAARGIGLLIPLLLFIPFLSADVLRLDATSFLYLALMALLNNIIGDLLLFVAIRDVGVSVSSPVSSSYPLIVALISWIGFGEEMTSHILIGTFAVVAGLVFLNAGKGQASDHYLRGIFAALLAAVCWALGLTQNKILMLRGVPPMGITFWRGVFFGLMSLLCLGFMRLIRPAGAKRAEPVSRQALLAGGASGIVALLLGGWVFATSVAQIPLSVATPIASSSPLIAALVACALMGERLRPIQWFGIACVVTGAVLAGS